MIEQINNIAGVWWAWMWPMFWQVGLLIAMIGLIDLLIRRRVWPQVRYALWLLVLVKLVLPPSLALPTSLTSALGPLARGVIWHQPLSDQTDMAGIEQSAPAMLPVSIEPTIAIGPETVPVDVAPSNPSAAIAADSVQLIGPTLGWQAYIMLAWLLGVLVLAGWLVVRFWQLRRAHRGKTALADPPQRLKQLLAETANKLRLRRLPQMVLSPTATSPAVFGVLRPVLLIPAEDIQRLSRTEIEHILLHELAHIKRGDLIVHAFNMLLQIIYWFNPLLWLVRRQLQHLRELCCDASVARILREKTTDYKETILETARRMLAKPVGPGMGLLGLFENANRLGARLKWLEKKSWKHRPLRIATILAVITLMCACILPMAKGQAKDKKDDLVMESKFTARLAGGVTVELLGVSELHSKAKHWWRPEGTLLDEPPCERLNKKGVPVKRNEIAYELVARISGLELLKRRSETPERWEIPEARRVGLGKSGIGNDQSGNPLPSLRITTAIVKQDLDRITVRFGIVPGLWQKNLSITAGETSKQKLPDVGIVVKPPYEKDGNAIVTIKVPNQIDSKVAVRVIAILKDGLVNDAPAWSRDGKIAFMSSSDNYEFFGLSLSDVDHFEILTGRYRWIEFRNVSLVPGKKTDVQVVTDSGDEQFNTLVRKLRQAPDDDARLLIAIDLERAGRPEAIPHLTEALKQVSFSHPSAARRIVRNIRNLERKNGLPPKNVFDGMYSQVLRTLDSDPTGRRLYAYDLQKADTVYIDSPEQVQETRENRIRRFVSEANSRADLAMILTPKKRLYALRGTRLAPLQIELKLPNVDWTDVRDEVHQSDLKELVVSYHKLKSKYVAGPAPSSQIHPFEPGDLFAVLLPSGQMAVLQTKQITDEPEGVQLAVYYLDPLLALCRNTGVATAITLSIPSEIQPATQAEELLAAAVELVDADETAGRYTWRVNREAPSRMVYGFHSISDTNKMEFIADAKDGIARKNAKDYALEFRREGPNLHLGVADWFFPPDSGGKGKFWDKTSWPNNSTFKTTYVGRAGNLTNAEYVTLWRGDFIREERVVKSILFSARLASQDDPVRRMLDANDPVQALKPLGISDVSKRPSGPLAFGPVIEKVLNSPDVKMVDNCIDLDTGKTFAFPTQDPFFPQWIETNQIDFAVGDAGRKDRRVTEITFAGIGAALVPAENQSWDILTPSAVQNRMSKVRATTGPRLSAMYRQKFGGERPQTFMFQTRDSGIGLLQILSLNPQDGALSIRYKLLQHGVQAAADSVTTVQQVMLSTKTLKPLAAGIAQALENDDAQTALVLLKGAEDELEKLESAIANTKWQTVLSVPIKLFRNLRGPLEAGNVEQARKIWQAIDAMGPDLESRIVEAAKKEQAAQASRRVVLPDVDESAMMLDLASGRLVLIPEVHESKLLAAIEELGRGDLVYDNLGKGPVLTFVRSAKPDKKLPSLPDVPAPYDIVSAPWPYKFKVTTREGRTYDVTVLKADEKGCEIEYKPIEPPVRKVFIPDADTKDIGVVLDLATGQMLNAGRSDQFGQFKQLGKGDLAFDRVLICLRGAESIQLRATRTSPLTLMEQRDDIRAYEIPDIPCQLRITIAEGRKFDVTVLSAENNGIHIEYKETYASTATQPGNDPARLTPAAVARGREETVPSGIIYRGTVTDAAGQPIGNVQARCDLNDYYLPTGYKRAVAETKTDKSGNFELGPLPKAEDRRQSPTFFFEHPDYALGWFTPSWKRDIDPQDIRITLVQPRVVGGVIKDSNGKPVRNAVVKASIQYFVGGQYGYLSLTERNGLAVTSDDNGAFLFRKIPEGARLHLSVYHKQYVTYRTQDNYRSDRHPIKSGTEDVQITLEPGGMIAGQLVLKGKPYKQGDIAIAARNELMKGSLAVTDEQGRFVLSGLPSGRYVIWAKYPSLADTGLVCMPKTDVDVRAGVSPTPAKLMLSQEQIVSGQIRNEKTNEPVADIRIGAILPAHRFVTADAAVTDSEGRYRLRLPPGNYELRVSGLRYKEYQNFTRSIHVSTDSPGGSLDMTITPLPMVQGRLTDKQGHPVQGTVNISFKKTATTEDGTFSFPEAILARRGESVGWAYDQDRKRGQLFICTKEKQWEIVVEPCASITGRLVDENGKALPEATAGIRVSLPSGRAISFGSPPWKVQRQPNGRFTASQIPLGLPIYLMAEKPGFQTKVDLADLRTGQVTDLGNIIVQPVGDFHAETKWNGTITGRILDENNKPVVGARVYATFPGMRPEEETTDTKGRYQLTGLPTNRTIRVGVSYQGYGHSSFKGLAGSGDYDHHITPLGYKWYGKQAPALQVEKWLNSEPLTLDQLRGKVVLLQLAVHIEHYQGHAVLRMFEKYKDRGLVVIAVHRPNEPRRSWVRNVTEEEISAYLKEHKYTFPVAIDRPEGGGATYRAYEETTPAMYLIDKKGILRCSPVHGNLDEWISRLILE